MSLYTHTYVFCHSEYLIIRKLFNSLSIFQNDENLNVWGFCFFFFLVYTYFEQSCFPAIVVMWEKDRDSENWKYKLRELVSTSDRISIFKLQSTSTKLALSGAFFFVLQHCKKKKSEHWLGESSGILFSVFTYLVHFQAILRVLLTSVLPARSGRRWEMGSTFILPTSSC